MTFPTDISGQLDARADEADDRVGALLRSAARKLESFSRAPGSRKDADRMTAVLTPEVVDALGTAFVTLRRGEIDAPRASLGGEFREADYAFAALLIAAGDPMLAASAARPLAEVADLIPLMAPKQAEHIQFLTGLYADAPSTQPLRDAAAARLGEEPETPAQAWARELGLGLPDAHWSLHLQIPAELETGHLDAAVTGTWTNLPGTPDTDWSIRVGAINANSLGDNRRPSGPDSPHGEYERIGRKATLTGAIAPATGPGDLPRVLSDLENAHPELRFDREALKVSSTPGRLISPTKKKILIAWLSSA